MQSIGDIISLVARQELGFEQLVDLARDRSVASRTRLVETVSDLFFDKKRTLTDNERALMVEILRRLIHDIEMEVRRTLAERLADEPDAPLELVRTLADDSIEVAHPILVRSTVLHDPELIEIVVNRTREHQLAIATRGSLSEAVSDALVGTGDADVIKTLLENHGAEIAGATMAYLVEQSKRIDSYQNPLVARPDLGPDLARRMYWWVSAAVRKSIIQKYNLDQAHLDRKITDIIDDVLDDDVKPSGSQRSDELAKKLANCDSITPQLLVQTLRQGEVALFESLLAELCGLRRPLVRRIVFEPGGQGLGVIARAVGISKPDFASIFLLSRSARPGDKVVDPGELSRVLAFYDRVQPTAATRLLERMRLDPEYLQALIEIDERAAPGEAEPEDLKAANSNG
jgi:uncharacterized protein (DUF2336 family)